MKAKLLVITLALTLLIPIRLVASYAVVTHGTSTPDGGLGGGATVHSLNTTGADLLIGCVSDYALGGSVVVVDNKSNMWSNLTSSTSGTSRATIVYSVPTTVGSSHDFTVGNGITLSYPTLDIVAVSGALQVSPFDQQNGATTAGAASLATGSITPSEANEFIFACLSTVSTSVVSINGGFTIQDAVVYTASIFLGSVDATLIQTSAAAANPTFSWTGSFDAAARIASFKSASAPPSTIRTMTTTGAGK